MNHAHTTAMLPESPSANEAKFNALVGRCSLRWNIGWDTIKSRRKINKTSRTKELKNLKMVKQSVKDLNDHLDCLKVNHLQSSSGFSQLKSYGSVVLSWFWSFSNSITAPSILTQYSAMTFALMTTTLRGPSHCHRGPVGGLLICLARRFCKANEMWASTGRQKVSDEYAPSLSAEALQEAPVCSPLINDLTDVSLKDYVLIVPSLCYCCCGFTVIRSRTQNRFFICCHGGMYLISLKEEINHVRERR